MRKILWILFVASAVGRTASAQTLEELARDWTRVGTDFLPFYAKTGAPGVPVEVTPGEPFLYGVALSRGAGSADPQLGRGDIAQLRLCRFDRVGRSLLLVQLPTGFREEGRAPESRALEESFANSVLASFTVMGEHDGRVVVDLGPFLTSGEHVSAWIKKDWSHDAARSLVLVGESGAYPRNTEFETLMTFVTGDDTSLGALLPNPRVLTLRIRHSFLRLPEGGFEPQPKDPRIGFFGPTYRDLSAPRDEPLERRLAARWRLTRRDPGAALSEPVEPIVLHLDPAIPARHREAVRRGALAWNRAFEAAGFRNAVVLRDLPEGASFSDARYSGIQWVHRAANPTSFGRIRTDPRTGEIVHAVVSLDSGQTRERTGIPRAQGAASVEEGCALTTAAPSGVRLDDKLIEADLAYTAAHEVGHILGLTHNFAASTYGGSVMDYLPPEYRVEDDRLSVEEPFPRGVGDYDIMAVRWAYTPGSDAQQREAIVREGLARGLVFPMDRDVRWAQYDLGPDPVAWLEAKLAQRRILLRELGRGELQPGESPSRLYEAFESAYTSHSSAVEAAVRLVGGLRLVNSLQGDGQQATERIPIDQQRRALDAVLGTLSPEHLEIPASLEPVLLLGPPPGTRSSQVSSATLGQSPARWAEEWAVNVLWLLVGEDDRLVHLTLPQEGPSLTLDAVLAAAVRTAWTVRAAPGARSVAVQRAVQRATVGVLVLLARSASVGEAKATALDHLSRLRGRLVAPATADRASLAHNRLLRMEIDEVLEPRLKAAS